MQEIPKISKSELAIIQHMYDVLKEIPEDKFITHNFVDCNDHTKGCAIGLYGMYGHSLSPEGLMFDSEAFVYFNKDKDLWDITDKAYRAVHRVDWFQSFNIASINNYPKYNGYTHPVIKHRVICFLEDILEHEGIKLERTVFRVEED